MAEIKSGVVIVDGVEEIKLRTIPDARSDGVGLIDGVAEGNAMTLVGVIDRPGVGAIETKLISVACIEGVEAGVCEETGTFDGITVFERLGDEKAPLLGEGLEDAVRCSSSHAKALSSVPSLMTPPISNRLVDKTSTAFARSSDAVLAKEDMRKSVKSPFSELRYQTKISVRPSSDIVLSANDFEVCESVTEKSASNDPTTTTSPVTGSIVTPLPD